MLASTLPATCSFSVGVVVPIPTLPVLGFITRISIIPLWTLQEAARRIGVQQTTLGRWENGEHFPDAAKMQTVCFVYGASEPEIVALCLWNCFVPCFLSSVPYAALSITRELLALPLLGDRTP